MKESTEEIKDLIKESDQLIKEIGWSVEEARKALIERHGKRSRYLLDANEWADWLHYLRVEKRHIKLLPSCREYELLALVEAEYIRLGWSDLEQKVQILRYTNRFGERFLSPQDLKIWLEHLRSLPQNKNNDRLDRRFCSPVNNHYSKKGV
jgi:hypothetical protein